MAPPANAAKTINAVIILYIIIYYINLPDTLCIKVFILFYTYSKSFRIIFLK